MSSEKNDLNTPPENTDVTAESKLLKPKKNKQISVRGYDSDKNYIDEIHNKLKETNEHATTGDALHLIIETAKSPQTIEKTIEVIKEVEKQVPVIEIQKEEVIKEVEKALNDNQVIFSFTPEIQAWARKVRPFMRNDGTLKSSDPDDQINEMLNTALKYYFRHKYDQIVNPL